MKEKIRITNPGADIIFTFEIDEEKNKGVYCIRGKKFHTTARKAKRILNACINEGWHIIE